MFEKYFRWADPEKKKRIMGVPRLGGDFVAPGQKAMFYKVGEVKKFGN
jgi:hypothetical protein